MIINFLKVAFRNLFRQFGYASINIAGLAIGLACSILISLYVINEITYDRFHEDAERIYRIGVRGKMLGNELNQAVTAAPMYQVLATEYPEIEHVTRIAKFGGWLVKQGERKFMETDETFKFADSTFFDVFTFPFIQGNPETALDEPQSLIMTQKAANRYFGNDNPMGKTVQVENDTTLYTVTGILEDIPVNSHFHFELLGSMVTIGGSRSTNWLNHNYYTYVTMFPGTDVERSTENINGIIEKYVGPLIQEFLGIGVEEFFAAGNAFGYFLQPLQDIHLYSNLQVEIEPNGNPAYVYIFSVIAVLILVIACINFMNLATARSTGRSREVGIRKVVGSNKSLLVSQFLTESVFLSLVALVLAVLLVNLVMPYYNNMIRMELRFDLFGSYYFIPLLLVLAILVGLLAGTYPAFVLASFRPAAVLKGELVKGAGKGRLRSLLVVIQFTIAIIILMGTFIVYSQLRFMQKKDLGFDKENVLVIRRSDALREQIDAFKQVLVNNSSIVSAGNSTHIPSRSFWNNAHWLEGQSRSDILLLMTSYVSREVADALDLEIVEGRFFSREMPTDSFAIVINEAAVKALNLEDPLTTRFYEPGQIPEEDQFRPVIGVVKDFHYESMHEDIHPMAFHFMPGNWEGYIMVRIQPENIPETVSFVKQTWEEFNSWYPFEYFWLDDEFGKLFEPERRTGQILAVFSILSVFVSCLGLLGLISFAAAQRTREVGIRKAMGASVNIIFYLLSKETIVLLGIATVLSVPFYFAVNQWLQNFAYHINFNPALYFTYLILVAVIVLTIAILSVSYQAFKAAMANPAVSLRVE
ncbi:MAG: ABC transporter permease [Bacteroidales bacterium]|nr:MAG: ABC transporter permease [Bacteroidales bacterium]